MLVTLHICLASNKYHLFQMLAMIVNLHDLSSYIFLNLLLTMLSVGAGYVVLSYR